MAQSILRRAGRRQCKILLSSTSSRPTLQHPQPPSQWVPGTFSSGLKRQGRQTDPLPPCSSEVKNGGAIPPLLHMSSWHSA
jgi:hypothetical protein